MNHGETRMMEGRVLGFGTVFEIVLQIENEHLEAHIHPHGHWHYSCWREIDWNGYLFDWRMRRVF